MTHKSIGPIDSDHGLSEKDNQKYYRRNERRGCGYRNALHLKTIQLQNYGRS